MTREELISKCEDKKSVLLEKNNEYKQFGNFKRSMDALIKQIFDSFIGDLKQLNEVHGPEGN